MLGGWIGWLFFVATVVCLASIAGFALAAASGAAGHFLESGAFCGVESAAALAEGESFDALGDGLADGSAVRVGDEEFEASFWEVDGADLDSDAVAEVEGSSGVFVDECAGVLDGDPLGCLAGAGGVAREVFDLDESVGEVLVDLDEDASCVETGDDTVEDFADLVGEELEDEEAAEFSFGVGCVGLGVADVASDGDEFFLGDERVGVGELSSDEVHLFFALGWLLAVVGECEVVLEESVCEQVGVAADGAGEVGVSVAGEGEVADGGG